MNDFRIPAEVGSTFIFFGQANTVIRYEGMTEGGGVLVGAPVGEWQIYLGSSMNEIMTGKPDDWQHLEALWGIKIIEMRYPRPEDEPIQFHMVFAWKDQS